MGSGMKLIIAHIQAGTLAARDLAIPGRELGGIHLALEYLEGQNRFLAGELSPEGRPLKFHAVPDTKETLEADLVFLAMGFTGVPADNPIVAQLGLAQTTRTALVSDPSRNIHCVGDCASGASLVVRAIASGKSLPLD